MQEVLKSIWKSHMDKDTNYIQYLQCFGQTPSKYYSQQEMERFRFTLAKTREGFIERGIWERP